MPNCKETRLLTLKYRLALKYIQTGWILNFHKRQTRLLTLKSGYILVVWDASVPELKIGMVV